MVVQSFSILFYKKIGVLFNFWQLQLFCFEIGRFQKDPTPQGDQICCNMNIYCFNSIFLSKIKAFPILETGCTTHNDAVFGI